MNLTCDVLVVGAGVAGVPAAVASARAGADTLLIEKRSWPGGNGAVGGHHLICGLYANETRPGGGAPGTLLNGGSVTRDITERLQGLAPGQRPFRLGKVDVLPYAPAQFQLVYNQLIQDEPQLRTRFDLEVHDVHCEKGRLTAVAASGAVILPQRVVDCSGAGVIIRSNPAWHEAPPGTGCQLAGFVIQFDGLDRRDDMLPIKIPYALRQGVDSGRLPPVLRFTSFAAREDRNSGACKMSVPAGTSLMAAQELARQLSAHLREALPALRNVRIASQSPEVLEREGPRLKGLYTLTAEDVLTAREFEDTVARNAWPIEMWDPQAGPTYRYLEPGRSYGIPLRCLRSKAVENLYCAGRCISVTHEALASTRVMGSCMALGEAAGRAAAGNQTGM